VQIGEGGVQAGMRKNSSRDILLLLLLLLIRRGAQECAMKRFS